MCTCTILNLLNKYTSLNNISIKTQISGKNIQNELVFVTTKQKQVAHATYILCCYYPKPRLFNRPFNGSHSKQPQP